MRTNYPAAIWLLIFVFVYPSGVHSEGLWQDSLDYPFRKMPDVYPGTKQLTWQGDLSVRMLDGAHKFVEEKISETLEGRKKFWKRDLSSPQAYEMSVASNRKRFLELLGVEDRSQPLLSFNVGLKEEYPKPNMEKLSGLDEPDLVAETSTYRVYQVKWPVLNLVNGEGLLLQPKTTPKGFIVALGDADHEPEQLAGLQSGIPKSSQFARKLAENGYEVLVPVLISRKILFEGETKQQTYREWIYRQAFHMGKHVIGYELQKVIAAIDWAKSKNANTKIGIAGYGEGGLIAFYSAAADTRIQSTLVSGYFNNRQKVWEEPLYRNVWGLLREFGDAEIASLIAPRSLTIEFSNAPVLTDEIKNPKENFQIEGLPFTGYKGRLQQMSMISVKQEFEKARTLSGKFLSNSALISNGEQSVDFGSKEALKTFVAQLGNKEQLRDDFAPIQDNRKNFDALLRQMRQVKEMENHVQEMLHDADQRRNRFFLHKLMPQLAVRQWSTKPYHPTFDSAKFAADAKPYREYFSREIIGKFDDDLLPFNARTRKIFDKGRFTGYEVVLDVYTDVFATGILLIPKDLKKGERRPVVVCQHGRTDIPHKMVEGNFTQYNDVASKLADLGFVVYVPQNPYKGEDRYRWLNRKANAVKATMFSFIVAQHDQATRWLATLPFVDSQRIAFYGLSYGGQTAMRVPAILNAYCLSICAGDFGDWARKITDTHYEGSFVNTLEWEMPFFNMGNTFNYAEMSYLIFPRPFMVERGHHDLVQPPEWVNYEYGKVRYFYDQFGLSEHTEIEQFNGGHSLRGEGTFRFLRKHLGWR